MEKEVFKPKLRITLLSENGSPQSDRLVDQLTEFNTGPKNTHNGPIRIETTLQNTQDVELLKQYLDRLSGTLPLKEPSAGRGRPAGNQNREINSPREEILAEVEKMVSEGKNQKEITQYLRKLGFVFILTEEFKMYFPDFEFNKKDVGEPTDNGQYLNSFSWMVRRIKKAKDPKADKFDPQIIFGFSILEGPSRKIVPYLYKERKRPLRAVPAKKSLSFSSVGFTKYPKYMLEEERLKFSFEQRQLSLNKEKKPSKFFLRWSKDVEVPDSIWESLKGRGIHYKNFKDE